MQSVTVSLAQYLKLMNDIVELEIKVAEIGIMTEN